MTDRQDPYVPAEGPQVAVILTPIPRPRFVTALCGLHKVQGTVLETSGGPIVVLDDASTESAERGVRALSSFLKGTPFLLAISRSGQVQMQEWRGGSLEGRPPAGLALADSPGVVTTLLSGTQTIAQVAETHEDKVHSTSMSRFAAYRELLKETRELKKSRVR